MHVFRYKQDIAPVCLVLALIAAQILLFVLVDNLYIFTAATAILVLLQGSATAVNHNHQHLAIFKQNALNRLLEVGLFFNTGCGPFAWVLHHTLGHHLNYLKGEEDTCSWKNKDGSTMSSLKFTVLNTLKIYPEIFRVGKKHPKILAKFKFWLVICVALLIALIIASPIKALILFVIPMSIQLFLLVFATADHHRGLDTQNQYEATRNKTTSRLNNLYSWNLGYHTAHHIKCGLHWSKLPDFHAEIEAKIPASLVQ